jgi:hypothetical protein
VTKPEFEGTFTIRDGDTQRPDETARGFFTLLYHLQIVEFHTTGKGIDDTSDTPYTVMIHILMEIRTHEIWRHTILGPHARSLALPIAMQAIQICIGRCVKNHHNTRTLQEPHDTVKEYKIDNLMDHLVELLCKVGTSNTSIDTLMTSIDCLAHVLTWNTGNITLDEV